MKNSILKNEQLRSPLNSFSVLKPKNFGFKKELVATVLLTSLVDAFSILVIYLIFNTAQTNDLIKNSQKIKLPMATQAVLETEKSVVIKIEENIYYINDVQTSFDNLFAELQKLKKEANEKSEDLSLIIQADEKNNYDQINPILVSSAASGFEKIKFAITPKGVNHE